LAGTGRSQTLRRFRGEYVHIVGATTLPLTHIDLIIPRNEFPFPPPSTEPNLFREKSWKAFLALEARRYRFASIYDPLLAINPGCPKKGDNKAKGL